MQEQRYDSVLKLDFLQESWYQIQPQLCQTEHFKENTYRSKSSLLTIYTLILIG